MRELLHKEHFIENVLRNSNQFLEKKKNKRKVKFKNQFIEIKSVLEKAIYNYQFKKKRLFFIRFIGRLGLATVRMVQK